MSLCVLCSITIHDSSYDDACQFSVNISAAIFQLFTTSDAAVLLKNHGSHHKVVDLMLYLVCMFEYAQSPLQA